MPGEFGASRLVYVSSVHAIPEKPAPETITEPDRFAPDEILGDYGKSKAMATALVLEAAQSGLNASVVLPSGILGPGDLARGNMTRMLLSFCRGRLPLGVKGGYDFVDVRDVAAGVLACTERGKAGECYIPFRPLREHSGLACPDSFPAWPESAKALRARRTGKLRCAHF